jgi:hypothetical protein
MNNLDRNWNNLFGEYTTDETAWYGQWSVYSPEQKLIKSQQAIRSFRSNVDNTAIAHINRYIDASENVEEKTWQIERETCNQPDGVIHPAMPSMRALSFGAGATAWTSQKLIPGKPCGVELFLRDGEWRMSVAVIYGENGQLNRITHIREHIGCFSDELVSLESSIISGEWIGKKRSMSSDLSISSEEDIQISFERISDRHKTIYLPGNTILMFSEKINVERPIQIAAGQRTTDHQLKYLTAHYATAGTFASLVSATLQS